MNELRATKRSTVALSIPMEDARSAGETRRKTTVATEGQGNEKPNPMRPAAMIASQAGGEHAISRRPAAMDPKPR